MRVDKIVKFLFSFFLFLCCCYTVGSAEPLTIRVGATLPLTGRLSIAGTDIQKGIELALKEFSSPGVSIQAIFDDNQHDPRKAVSSAHKLLDLNNVDVLVSMWDMAEVVAPLAEQKKVPHLAIRWNPDITDQYKYTFTVESTFRSYVDSLFELLKKSSVHSVVLLTEEGQGWLLAAEYLKEHSSEHHITVLSDEHFLPTENDYKGVALRATKASPDMVILLSNPPHTQALIKQLRESAPQQRFTGYFEIIEPSLIEGILFPAQFEVADWFVTKFKAMYGELPKSRAAQGYDIIHLLSIAASQTGKKPTIEALINAVNSEAFRSNESAAGPLIIKNPKVIESKCVWKIARGGKFELVENSVVGPNLNHN